MSIDPFKPIGPLPGGSGPMEQPSGPGTRVCEACNGSVSGPDIYGSGRFCSAQCAQLRTKDRHWDWLLDHPEQLAEWQAAEKKRKTGKKSMIRNMPL